MKKTTLLAVLFGHLLEVLGQTWCDKNYMINQTVVPPDGQFPVPATSEQTLLAFRCAPAIKPYLAEDKSGSIIIDTGITHTKVNGAAPFTATSASSNLAITVTVNGRTLVTGSVPVNASGHELSFSLGALKPQKTSFELSCTAKSQDGQTFHSTAELLFMPNPTSGSVTKMDLRTGALLVNPTKAGEASWEPIFPIGFYTNFDGYLATNLSILNDLKARGFTIVHPVPTFDNLTALAEVLDRMEEVGLYLMYDMRFTYMNNTAVTEQVNMIKGRNNLLLWYTGDEPDGTSDPLNATTIAYDLINDLDGYHPVSLVLNCQDYQFTAYTQGTDIVMQDTYPIDINATFSVEWHTPCTPDFGDCGCDNCKGNFADISTRMDEFKERLEILGETRTKAVWGVPQAFGGEEYWPRPPTGQEWLVQSVLSINHGALGIVPWNDPTTQDIKDSATSLAQALPAINPFLFNPATTFKGVTSNGIDVGLWVVGSKTLLLATNMNYASASLTVGNVSTNNGGETQLLNSGGSLQVGSTGQVELSLDAVGTIGYII